MALPVFGLMVEFLHVRSFQLATALAVDAISAVIHGLSSMLTDPESEIFRTFRRGQVYNNGTRGLQCRTGPAVPWVHGPSILSSFLAVSLHYHHNHRHRHHHHIR